MNTERITPNRITSLKPDEIFVFGSNFAGRHGKGAAKTALKWGAIPGRGIGFMGQTYGIATKNFELKTVSLDEIQAQIGLFLCQARGRKDKKFLVTEIGCGLAGYKPAQVAPLFFEYPIPDNVYLPARFWAFRPEPKPAKIVNSGE